MLYYNHHQFEVELIVYNILLGLDELHSKNIVHTDIKPENIMLNIFPDKILLLMVIVVTQVLNSRNSYD